MRCALVSCHRLEPKQKTSLRGYSLTEVPPLFPLWHLPQFSDTLRLCIYNICLSGKKRVFHVQWPSPYFFLFLILTKQTKIWLQHTRIAMELKEKKRKPRLQSLLNLCFGEGGVGAPLYIYAAEESVRHGFPSGQSRVHAVEMWWTIFIIDKPAN